MMMKGPASRSAVPAIFVAAAVMMCSAGCNDGPAPALKENVVPAAGTISFQGQPLDHYQLTLYPSDKRRPATGTTDAQGNFTLGTNTVDDGAPAGTHKLVVTHAGPPVQQESGKEEAYTPPPPTVKVSPKYSSAETSDATVTVPTDGSRTLKIELK